MSPWNLTRVFRSFRTHSKMFQTTMQYITLHFASWGYIYITKHYWCSWAPTQPLPTRTQARTHTPIYYSCFTSVLQNTNIHIQLKLYPRLLNFRESFHGIPRRRNFHYRENQRFFVRRISGISDHLNTSGIFHIKYPLAIQNRAWYCKWLTHTCI